MASYQGQGQPVDYNRGSYDTSYGRPNPSNISGGSYDPRYPTPH